jgi:ribosomal protein S18 acetylase RimI-like enzyme
MISVSSKEKGRGYGTIVYQNFEKIVQREFNIRNIYAFTRESNTDAIRWYTRIGFTTTIVPNMYSDEPTKAAVILTKEIMTPLGVHL